MFKFMLKCKVRVSKCGGVDKKLNNFPRHNLTFVANAMMQTGRYREKAKSAIYLIINNVYYRQELNKGLKKTYKLVRFMQRKFRDRMIFKACKFLIMEKFWYDTLGALRKQNETLNSMKMREVIK